MWRVEILWLDVNARLGSLTCERAGGLQLPQDKDQAGHIFHRCLAANQLFAANTLLPSSGAGHTWTASGSELHRSDYGVVDGDLFPLVSEAEPKRYLDTGTS